MGVTTTPIRIAYLAFRPTDGSSAYRGRIRHPIPNQLNPDTLAFMKGIMLMHVQAFFKLISNNIILMKVWTYLSPLIQL